MSVKRAKRKESVTCRAPVNIAVVKYWGKRDEELILPINSSISATLHIDHMCATTTVAASRDFTKDRIWLNGKEESFDNPRLQSVLKAIRERAADNEGNSHLTDCHLHICSKNNFPTAAGLASSAAGYACLVSALSKLFNIQGNVTDIARIGSGSACRSLDGGFVQWIMGEKDSGVDSIGEQIVDEDYWPEMRVLILVVSGKKKPVGSSQGMLRSVQTSPFLKYRAEVVVPEYMQRMLAAIKNKDFLAFAEITMKESNQLHAVCQDTYPPISYMNDTSWSIVRLVHAYNNFKGAVKMTGFGLIVPIEVSVIFGDWVEVAYTFDAGPNAALYLQEENVTEVLSFMSHFFPPGDDQDVKSFFKGLPCNTCQVSEDLLNAVSPMETKPGAVKYIIHTKPGPGAQEVSDEGASLLDENGLPKELAS
ncbi:Diphosphomevalonate decarboxylase [Holothuria leucospilota]|uniref:Diphosphomevalonate decarboxylase n=1 Tax=Holothuria leucospilota TaxID=206669 RepID=A0A9Q1HD69_HOLLE|nr:Diphosphomevalonate decarboxylase [Holothuria leucospilota]